MRSNYAQSGLIGKIPTKNFNCKKENTKEKVSIYLYTINEAYKIEFESFSNKDAHNFKSISYNTFTNYQNQLKSAFDID